MALDMEMLEDGPDLDTIDTSNVDRGDKIEGVADEFGNEPDPVVKADPVVEDDDVVEDDKPAATDDDPAKDQPRDEKGKFAIPKERFDEAVGKERQAREAAETRAQELERQLQERQEQTVAAQNYQEREAEITALEKAHTRAMLDGDADVAADLAGQIRRATMSLTEDRSTQRSAMIAANNLEGDRVDAAIARLQADHPFLNNESESFDPALVGFILSEQTRLIQTDKMQPSKALIKAADKIIERFGPKAAPAPAAAEGLDKAKPVTDRKAAAVAKNVAAANKQPASMRDSGFDSDKAGQSSVLPEVSKMSTEEFAALPDSMKARIRGDFI